MQYGYFDDYRREYVITRPDTPLPWINYLGNEEFFSLISNTAGGYAFYKDARMRRITRYRYNNVPQDRGGRYIYIRDRQTSDFWSPTWQPVCKEPIDYECRHGMGYTRITSGQGGIRASINYFVPMGQNLEIWNLDLTNANQNPVDLQVFSAVEFALWDAHDDSTNFQRNLNIGEVEVEGSVIYHKTEYRERRDHFAYFACSEPLASFDTQRESFLGPYRGWENPVAVEGGACGNSHAHGWSPIGSHQVDLSLGPGDTKNILFILGYHENPKDQKFDPPDSQTINKRTVQPVIRRFSDQENVDDAFERLREYWKRILSTFQTQTPNEHTNRMVNTWNAYQCIVTFNLSRSASYFESGVGRGIGFRDSNQDLLGTIHMIPDRSRERILDLAATQLENGGAYHQYQPLTKRGNDAVGSNFNDDPLWLVLSVAAYLKETADWKILDEPVPYDNQPGSESPLYEHLQRSIQYTLDRLGPHGLPLIGRADWNDCLNLNTFSDEPGESFQTTTNRDGKIAESIFIGGLFVLAAKEMAQITARRGESEDSLRYLESAASMEITVAEDGWDGNWFLRAYDAFGEKIGSHERDEGQLFIEPQGLNVMAGIGLDDGYAHQAMEAVYERLATQHGVLLHQPAYTRYQLNLGEISSYPPGYKENAGIFCHTNPWIMIAETRLGNGDRALDYYLRINPSAREQISEVHRCEPYVYSQMIAGRDAPSFGEAKNSWLSGSAAWNYVAITQWILGIRPTYDGLRVAPVIPKDWEGFRAYRRYLGVDYHFIVLRKGDGNDISLLVDGEPVKGNIVPPPTEGQESVAVEATLS